MEFAEPKIDLNIERKLLRKFNKFNDLCIDGFVTENDTIAEILSSPTRNGKVFLDLKAIVIPVLIPEPSSKNTSLI
jgi:hypothetical protein